MLLTRKLLLCRYVFCGGGRRKNAIGCTIEIVLFQFRCGSFYDETTPKSSVYRVTIHDNRVFNVVARVGHHCNRGILACGQLLKANEFYNTSTVEVVDLRTVDDNGITTLELTDRACLAKRFLRVTK